MQRLFWIVVGTVFVVLGWQGVSFPQELSFEIPEGWTPTTPQSPKQKVYALLVEGNTVRAELVLTAEEVPPPPDLNGYFRNVQQHFQSTLESYTPQEVVPFQGQGISGVRHTFLFSVQGTPSPLQGMLFLFPLGNTMYALFFDCRAEDFAHLEARFLRVAQSLKATHGTPQEVPQGERWTYQDDRYSFSLPIPPGSTVAQILDNGAVYQTPNQGQLAILRFDDEAGVQEVIAQVTQGKDFHGSSSLVTQNGSAVQVSLYSSRNPQTNIQYATLLGVFPGHPLLVIIIVPASEYQNAQEWMGSIFTKAVVGQAQTSSPGGDAEGEAMTYFFDGVQYAARGRYDEAILAYSRAIEIWPGFARAYVNRGNAYQAKGLHDEAIRDYTRVLAIDPKDAEAYFNKAMVCERAGRFKEAVEAYRGFIQYAPPDSPYIEHAKKRIEELER